MKKDNKKFAQYELLYYLCNNKQGVRPHKNQSSMKKLIEAIQEIAEQNPDGFTVELTTLKKVSKGISVAYLETQDSFGNEGLKKVLLHSQSHDGIIGGWLNEENGKFYYDSIKIFHDEKEAVKFGIENEQIAIFDITNLRLIKL